MKKNCQNLKTILRSPTYMNFYKKFAKQRLFMKKYIKKKLEFVVWFLKYKI